MSNKRLRARSVRRNAEMRQWEKHRIDVFRVELLGARGEADEVGEEDRDDLPLPACLGHLPSLGALHPPTKLDCEWIRRREDRSASPRGHVTRSTS